MAPDLNSLPPSQTSLPRATSDSPSPSPLSSVRSASRATMQSINTSQSPQHHTPSPHRPSGDATPVSPTPRSGSMSLQAAATLNAGLQRSEPARPTSQSPSSLSRHSPTTGRRRSQVLIGLQMADPAVPGPGEMIGDSYQMAGLRDHNSSASPLMLPQRWDPEHVRTPSLGELHQELENEQEFQVNRLLQEIRRLQAQVQRQNSGPGQSAISDEPASDRSGSLPIHPPTSTSFSGPRSPSIPMHPRSSFDMARADLQRRSRTPSRGASPRLRSASISGDSGEHWVLGGRDESAFYQAETQMLTRENQMLRHRIHELERQLREASGTGSTSSSHEPSHASHLHRSTSIAEEEATRPTQLTPTPLATVADAPKEE